MMMASASLPVCAINLGYLIFTVVIGWRLLNKPNQLVFYQEN